MEGNRKSLRLENFDYNSPGSYFITICTQNRAPILGRIVGGGALDAPFVELSDAGIAVQTHIERINLVYSNLTVDKYVIMPNHIHMILTVTEHSGTSRAPSPTNAIIPHAISTLKRFVGKDLGISIFQRSFHDHIIRNRADYLEIWHYIDTNPLRWESDEFYT